MLNKPPIITWLYILNYFCYFLPFLTTKATNNLAYWNGRNWWTGFIPSLNISQVLTSAKPCSFHLIRSMVLNWTRSLLMIQNLSGQQLHENFYWNRPDHVTRQAVPIYFKPAKVTVTDTLKIHLLSENSYY